jgi:hypothetical protein
MKYKSIILILIIFLSAPIFLGAQTKIVTSQGTFVLTPPPGKCINSTCLNGIIRIAELAAPALAADVSAAGNEAKKLSSELQTVSTSYKNSYNEYITAKAPYDAKLGIYTQDVNYYNAKEQSQRTAAEKSNLDNRKAVLNGEKDVLMTQWNALEVKKNDVSYKIGEVQGVTDKLNKALEQLKLCQHFGEEALRVSKEKKWGSYQTINDFFGTLKIIPSIELLNNNLEQLKSLSDKVWD